MRQLTRACLIILASLGILSCAIGVGVEFAPVLARAITGVHPARSFAPHDKPALERIDPLEAEALLDALDGTQPDFIERATMLLSAALVNYWPAPTADDPSTDCGFLENPIYWAKLRRFERGDDETLEFLRRVRRERTDWRMALHVGIGYCSQQSLVLAGYLRDRGIVCRVVALGGHVVVAANTDRGEWVLDPSYGVVLKCSLAELELNPDRARALYLAAKYPAQQVEFVLPCFGPELNDTYQPLFLGQLTEDEQSLPLQALAAGALLFIASMIVLRYFPRAVVIASSTC